MLKDLNFESIDGVRMAIAKTPENTGEATYYLYLINNKKEALVNALVMTEATENEDGSGRKTSKLRHFFNKVEDDGAIKVETIDSSVFGFYNKVWLSFYIDKQIYELRFTFLPFKEWDLETITELDLKGRLAI
jgi:hypothetical protein